MKKGLPRWNVLENKIPRKARAISRKEAERLEDNWNEPFWDVHELDLSDATYELHRGEEHFLFAEISEGELLFHVEAAALDDPRESVYRMDSDNTHRFLVQLRLKHGIRNKLSTILKKELGKEDGAEPFFAFCREYNIQYQPLRIF